MRDGRVDEALVDRSVTRALTQKAQLGLLDATFEGEPPSAPELDSARHRALAARLAEESVVLLANDGLLPLERPGRVAVVGPNAHRVEAMFGCYSFVNHVLAHHPEAELGIEVPTLVDALTAALPGSEVTYEQGCAVDDGDTSGFPSARAAAEAADVAVVVVGDHAALFGRGTVGEGCDRDDLELPGVQRALVEEVLDTGTPVVLVLLTGRPYAVGWALDRCAAVLQAFFPGEEGGSAIAGVLTGRVNPSGRLPVSLPRPAGAQPYTYLRPPLGGDSDVTNLSSAPARPFGFGLSYTTFAHEDLRAPGESSTGEPLRVTVRVTNTGDRAGADVVQLYGHDVVASVTRPVAQLLGFQRVVLDPGASTVVELVVPPARFAFTSRDGTRVVEPGAVELWVGASCEHRETEAVVHLTGDVHRVAYGDELRTRSSTG